MQVSGTRSLTPDARQRHVETAHDHGLAMASPMHRGAVWRRRVRVPSSGVGSVDAVTEEATAGAPAEGTGNTRLAVLLAMAMFVLVVDTSLMNVSISAVVHDLDTTVSGVQSAIAIEALVSAAFILISSKVGDLIGRKRAYVLGLLAYAVGAAGDDTRPEPDHDHRLLGDHRWPRRVAPAPGDAIADPRKLRWRGTQAGVRAGGRRGGDRGGGRTAARWLRHHVPVVARRVRPRGRDHRDRAVADQTRPRRGVHRTSQDRPGRCRPLRHRHGWRRPRHPGLARRRRVRRTAHRVRRDRALAPGLLARETQARGQGDPARPGSVPVPAFPDRGHPADAATDHARRRDDRRSRSSCR